MFSSKTIIDLPLKQKGIIEKLTPLKNWMAIKTGDIIYSRKTKMPRKVIEGKDGFVRLMKIRQGLYPTETTMYVPCDRHFFIVPAKD